MTPHDQSPLTHISSAPTSAPLPAGEGRQGAIAFFGVALTFAVLFGGGYLTLRGSLEAHRDNPGGAEESIPPDTDYPADHRKWQKPAFALILSGQMHGYTDPCGCSKPQYGGLPRRYNFVQSLKAKQWNVVGVDLGELPQLKGIPDQNLLKYELSVRSLAAMDYKVLGVGREELLSPLGEALSRIWDKKTVYPRPILLTLADAQPGRKYHDDLNARQWEIFETNKVKIGVINMVGPDLRVELNGKEEFLANMQELPKALKAFADAGVQFGIILHHEYPNSKFAKGTIPYLKDVDAQREKQVNLCAEFCNAARKKNPRVPPIQLMMMLTEEPEPPTFMKELGDLLPRVVEIGHKGKYVGLVGVYQDKAGFRLQYQKVLMGPEWETPSGKEKDNRVTQIQERYHQVLKDQDMLAKAVRAPHANQVEQNAKGLTATFVGSNACRNCHKEAFAVWDKPNGKINHRFATETLEAEKNPSGRQYDPECMKCHVTGFPHPGGYNDLIANLAGWAPGKKAPAPSANLLAHNMKLRGVGCESCHGPASEHVKQMNDVGMLTPQQRLLINPYRPTDEERRLQLLENKSPAQVNRFNLLFDARMGVLNRFCIQCHDSENDVHWNDKGVVKKWIDGGIIHRTNPAENRLPGKGLAVKGEPPPIVIEVFEEKKK